MEYPDAMISEKEMATIASISTQAVKETKRKKKAVQQEPERKSQPPPFPNPDNPELLARAAKAMNETLEAAKRGQGPEPGHKEETPEAVQKQKLLNKIGRYYDYFPFLKEEAPKKFTMRDSVEALQEECRRCQAQLQNSQTLENIKALDILLNDVLERVAIGAGTPAHGLVYEAKRSRMVVDQELKELSIKYESWLTTGPELRYLFKTYSRFNMIVSRNRGMNDIPVDEETQNKYDEY